MEIVFEKRATVTLEQLEQAIKSLKAFGDSVLLDWNDFRLSLHAMGEPIPSPFAQLDRPWDSRAAVKGKP